jgi:hypothetical protein
MRAANGLGVTMEADNGSGGRAAMALISIVILGFLLMRKA